MKQFGLNIWGDDNFLIENDTVNINYANQPSLLEITKSIREKGYKGPLLLRFPHLIKKQISTLFDTFEKSQKRV
jgi:arginine decarboxylase